MTAFSNRDPLDPAPSSSGAPSPGPIAPASDETISAKPFTQPETGNPFWLVLGPQGLRAGWSILLFVILIYLLANILGTFFSSIVRGILHVELAGETAGSTIVSEGAWVASLTVTLAILAR